MTALAAVILATMAPPRIEWLPCLVETPDREVVRSHRPVEVGPPPRITPFDLLRQRAK